MHLVGRTTARSPWLQLLVASWFVISVWPVYRYYFPPTPEFGTSETSAFSYIDPLVAARNVDHFSHYIKRDNCTISTLELHKPSYPLCIEKDTQGILNAISGGGRIGTDAPYQPRGCDMRWFTTPEICDILSRFEKITIMGDSLMRDVALAIHIFLREDLVDGGHWDQPEGQDCTCQNPWNNRNCGFHLVINSDLVYSLKPELMACPKETSAYFKYHVGTSFPIAADQIQGYQEGLFATKPPKPHAILMGAGLWDDIDQNKTKSWVDQVVNATIEAAPWMFDDGQWVPRLFLTPNAAHAAKNPKYWAKQGNIPISMFELGLGSYVRDVYGMDHLGTFNMSIQASSYDGTHAGMRVNLLKAMAIFNWLNSLDVSMW